MAAAVARLASGNQAKSTDGTEMLTAPETEQSDAAPAPFEQEGAQKKGAAGAAAGAAAGFVKPSPVTGGPNMEAMLRQGFVRKVYGILAVQVAVTFGLIGVFQTQSINDMMKECHKITCVDGTTGEKVECLAAAGRLNPVPGGLQMGTDTLAAEPGRRAPWASNALVSRSKGRQSSPSAMLRHTSSTTPSPKSIGKRWLKTAADTPLAVSPSSSASASRPV